MRVIPVVALLLVTLVPLPAAAATAPSASCQFVLGFRALHDLIPTIVGDCVVDEHHNAVNGDGLQEALTPSGGPGLLVWRKADNWTAFTDGYRTWVNGPFGLQERLNTECFWWEDGCVTGAGAASGSIGGTTGAPPPSVTFTTVSGAAPGGTASVTVQTAPSLLCQIDYWGPKGVDRFEFGDLHQKISDANGQVSWSWPISGFTPLGSGTVTVTCDGVAATTALPIGTTPISVSFTAVSGAAPGGTASVTIQTSPGAFCKVDYFGPRGHDRFEFGALHLKQADANGTITWSWLIAPNTPSGNGTVTVSCEGVTQSTSVPIA